MQNLLKIFKKAGICSFPLGPTAIYMVNSNSSKTTARLSKKKWIDL